MTIGMDSTTKKLKNPNITENANLLSSLRLEYDKIRLDYNKSSLNGNKSYEERKKLMSNQLQ
jgi:hypothetical protein